VWYLSVCSTKKFDCCALSGQDKCGQCEHPAPSKFVTVPAQGGSCLPSSALAHRKQHSVKLLASLLQHSCTSTKTQIIWKHGSPFPGTFEKLDLSCRHIQHCLGICYVDHIFFIYLFFWKWVWCLVHHFASDKIPAKFRLIWLHLKG